MIKLLSQTPPVPATKVNHFERAKNYIKDLESMGRMMPANYFKDEYEEKGQKNSDGGQILQSKSKKKL